MADLLAPSPELAFAWYDAAWSYGVYEAGAARTELGIQMSTDQLEGAKFVSGVVGEQLPKDIVQALFQNTTIFSPQSNLEQLFPDIAVYCDQR